MTESSIALLDNVRVVLVHTSHGGNIGGAARAMKNMGVSDLVLVQPKDFPSGDARARAANARDVLENSRVVDTLEQAVEDCVLVIGTSARDRRIPWPIMDARESAVAATDGLKQGKVAIVFGREDRGLTNEELQRCQFHLHISTNEDYSSLNLGAAVQVVCYELRMALLAQNGKAAPFWGVQWDNPPPEQGEVQQFYDHLDKVLLRTGFLDERALRQSKSRLTRLFNRVLPDKMELGMLRGVLSSVEKTLDKASKKSEKGQSNT